MNAAKHPLLDYEENERVDYLCVVASIASADSVVSDSEISKLRETCKSLKISANGIGRVVSTAENPSATEINKIIKKLSDSDLKFTLITDMIFLAFADNQYSEKEKMEIERIASIMNVKKEQISAIEKYVRAILKTQDSTSKADDLKKLGGEVTASLASAGIPMYAVAISGYSGISAAGITSGLAALGLGMGMLSGIGVVSVIGVGSYLGVRFLYKKVTGV